MPNSMPLVGVLYLMPLAGSHCKLLPQKEINALYSNAINCWDYLVQKVHRNIIYNK